MLVLISTRFPLRNKTQVTTESILFKKSFDYKNLHYLSTTMKLTYVFALALIPASLAFAPVGLKSSAVRADSSLNGFLSDLFSDRTNDKADQESRIAERLAESIVKGLEGVTEGAEVETKPKNVVVGNFKHMPTKEMTGVETNICRLAATMAAQCYDIQNEVKDTFMLSTKEHEVDTIIVTKQDKFRPTNPTFGAAVCDDTMILAWRGTSPDGAPMDLVNDIACSPCSNMVWREHAKTLKVQGAMQSLCANDIVTYEETLISECKKRGIKEIVTTGHSLGGGIGQVAHTIIRAQMQDGSSPWSELNDDVTVRSVVFSAPMTTVLLDEYSEKTDKFMDEIDEHSCNLIFYNDPVPRAYGYLSFLEDLLDDALPYLGKWGAEAVPLPFPNFILQRQIDKILEKGVTGLLSNDLFEDLLSVMSEYVHPGKIVYYETPESEPRVLTDKGFAYDGPAEDTFRSVKYIPERQVSPLEVGMDWHNDIVRAPGLAYDDSVLH